MWPAIPAWGGPGSASPSPRWVTLLAAPGKTARNSRAHPISLDLQAAQPRKRDVLATMPDPALWTQSNLPKTWVNICRSPRSAVSPRLLERLFAARSATFLPRRAPLAGVPGGKFSLPDYLLQEFHGCRTVTTVDRLCRVRPRIRGRNARADEGPTRPMAERFAACRAVLDVGCGAGRLAQVVRDRGVDDVWVSIRAPTRSTSRRGAFRARASFRASREDMQFSAGRFDGIGVCFVLHELPRLVVERAVAEFARLTRPGGVLVITGAVAGARPRRMARRRCGAWGARHVLQGAAWLSSSRFLTTGSRPRRSAPRRHARIPIETDRLGVPFREIVARRHGSAPI